MAIPVGSIFQVYLSTGNNANGALFVPGRPGIDYSRQASPQLSITDLASPNTTHVTSAAGGFRQAMVGNGLRISSGTNFVADRYVIDEFVSVTEVILDRNPTTGATASAGVARVGGAALTVADIGTQAPAGSFIFVDLTADTGTTEMRDLFRELTGEKYAATVSDAVVDQYLQRGLEWYNQVTEYKFTTGAAGVTLVAGQQEYVLASDVVRVHWVEWNGHELIRGDIEEWRRRGEDWRSEEAGTPEQWAVYGQRIVFRPAPNAAAVAVQATPVIRYISDPPSITTNGPEDVPAQDRRLPVYYGAHLWSIAYPDSALATQRSSELLKRSMEEGQFAQRDSQAKETKS